MAQQRQGHAWCSMPRFVPLRVEGPIFRSLGQRSGLSSRFCGAQGNGAATFFRTREPEYSDHPRPSSARGLLVTAEGVAAEVVLPRTTTEERLVRLDTPEDLAALRAAVGPGMALESGVELPDATGRRRPLRPGLTVHGRLGAGGSHRRWYWALGDRRAEAWLTTAQHGREQRLAEPGGGGGGGELEDRLWSPADLAVGDVLVLRRGVGFAELCAAQRAEVFVSHWSRAGEPREESNADCSVDTVRPTGLDVAFHWRSLFP